MAAGGRGLSPPRRSDTECVSVMQLSFQSSSTPLCNSVGVGVRGGEVGGGGPTQLHAFILEWRTRRRELLKSRAMKEAPAGVPAAERQQFSAEANGFLKTSVDMKIHAIKDSHVAFLNSLCVKQASCANIWNELY